MECFRKGHTNNSSSNLKYFFKAISTFHTWRYSNVPDII